MTDHAALISDLDKWLTESVTLDCAEDWDKLPSLGETLIACRDALAASNAREQRVRELVEKWREQANGMNTDGGIAYGRKACAADLEDALTSEAERPR